MVAYDFTFISSSDVYIEALFCFCSNCDLNVIGNS